MDETWEHYRKCNGSDRQIPYDLFHMWNQKKLCIDTEKNGVLPQRWGLGSG